MKIGSRGEEIAKKYMLSKGYSILETNFRYRQGEIDIIASKNGSLVFIEVKTRKNRKYGLPREAVNLLKKRHIYQTAQVYINQNLNLYSIMRFDVIEVYFEEEVRIEHIINAFDGNDLGE